MNNVTGLDIKFQLEDKIQELEQEDLKIEEKMNLINDLVKSIDDTVWLSPRKNQVFEQLIPYIDNKLKSKTEVLTEITDTMRKTLNLYKEKDIDFKNKISKSQEIDVL